MLNPNASSDSGSTAEGTNNVVIDSDTGVITIGGVEVAPFLSGSTIATYIKARDGTGSGTVSGEQPASGSGSTVSTTNTDADASKNAADTYKSLRQTARNVKAFVNAIKKKALTEDSLKNSGFTDVLDLVENWFYNSAASTKTGSGDFTETLKDEIVADEGQVIKVEHKAGDLMSEILKTYVLTLLPLLDSDFLKEDDNSADITTIHQFTRDDYIGIVNGSITHPKNKTTFYGFVKEFSDSLVDSLLDFDTDGDGTDDVSSELLQKVFGFGLLYILYKDFGVGGDETDPNFSESAEIIQFSDIKQLIINQMNWEWKKIGSDLNGEATHDDFGDLIIGPGNYEKFGN